MKSNIRKLRNERNITQSTLAQVLGKTQQSVSHMENDRDRISIESLIALSEYFGVSTDCVLGLEPEENESEESGTVKKKDPQVKVEPVKTSTGENKKLLYQLILTLLLDSIDDDTQNVIGALGSHV